jgi:catechol 2,3-dioxygenase-like lactoylglutathione lyase family enzyme
MKQHPGPSPPELPGPPERIVIIPAVGPIPPLYVPKKRGEPATDAVLWHVLVRAARLAFTSVRHPLGGKKMSNKPVVPYGLEVVTLAVHDVDRALAFYTRQLGFVLDVDYHPVSTFRVVQLTPPGSRCSIQIGVGLTDAPPGTTRASYLVVSDIEATHRELKDRRVPVGPICHKTPIEKWEGCLQEGVDPERRDYASVASFNDPDDNGWIIQEVGYRPPQSSANAEPPTPADGTP